MPNQITCLKTKMSDLKSLAACEEFIRLVHHQTASYDYRGNLKKLAVSKLASADRKWAKLAKVQQAEERAAALAAVPVVSKLEQLRKDSSHIQKNMLTNQQDILTMNELFADPETSDFRRSELSSARKAQREAANRMLDKLMVVTDLIVEELAK